jgi:tellurite resistance protein TerC
VVSVVSPLVWALTVVVLIAIIVLDLTVIARRQRTVTTKDAVRWVLVYIGLAAVFAAGLFAFLPGSAGQEFVAGYITEYSLSVDNLFVFMIIMARFSVPALAQDKVLYIGIVLSLVLRAVFIFAGAAAIAAASWVLHPRRVSGLHRDPAGAGGSRRGAGLPQQRRAAVPAPDPADQRGLRRPAPGHPRG